MNDKELHNKVTSSMYTLIKEKGIASSVEVLMDIGVLTKENYENWRFGRVSYLERVCQINLRKLSVINREIRAYAMKNNLKSSVSDYRKWGKGNRIQLRFSKSGDRNIEKHYATHYSSKSKTPQQATEHQA